MPHVLILGTGGTIAGTASDPSRSWAYRAAQLGVEQLVSAVPELAGIALATQQAGKQWLLLDLTNAFPEWMASQEYRDAYFESPEDLAGYQSGELTEFVADLTAKLKNRISAEAGSDTVVALMGVGTLFGLARVSSVVEGIKEAVEGRLVVFFPGEHHPENHTYRLLDARDGWNYLAVPLLAKD